MNKKIRYSLIILGSLLFLLLAPFVALYSAGITYDFKTGQFYHTGIFAFRTEPEDAKIYIDGKFKKSGSSYVRFLKPGFYTLSFNYEGFCSWEKRLEIKENQVTWANAFTDKIYLLKQNQAAKESYSDILDFYSFADKVYMLKKNNIQTRNAAGHSETTELKTEAVSFSPVNQAGDFIVNGTSAPDSITLVQTNTKNTVDLSGKFKNLKKSFLFGQRLISLDGSNLVSTDISTKIQTLLDQNVLDFSLYDSEIFLIKPELQELGIYSASANDPYKPELITALPEFKKTSIYLSHNKQIYLLADNNLYQVGLNKLNSLGHAENLSMQNNMQHAVYFSQGELNSLNFTSGQKFLITRTSQMVRQPHLASNTGYAFLLKDQSIEALELDNRDKQNTCALFTGQNIKKFSLDEKSQRLWVLDGSELKEIVVR